jgi:WhiB family redox-sensing transcriptional regulator
VYVRSVPCDGGMITEQSGGGAGPDEVRLRSVPSVGSALPCRNGDADLWFAEAPAELEEAKSRCGGCPLRQACLDGALERDRALALAASR